MSSLLTDEALGDIQGVITSSYGHLPQTAYLFVHMTTPTGARRWIEVISGSVTSSKRWPVGRDMKKEKPRTAINVALTAEGLRACGLPEDVLRTFPAEFQDGMASPDRSRILGDADESAPALWEVGGPATDPVHAVLFLFAADEAALDALCREQRAVLDACSDVAEIPSSAQQGNRPDTSTEHFGFHDGIAQPSIAGLGGEGVPTGEFILGYENHYGLMPPTPVVPRTLDANAMLPRLANPYHFAEELGDLGQNGSYLAYRKLQQDVAAFWHFMSQETARGGAMDAARTVWLASKCVGRWPSGAPLILAPDADDPALGDRDDFFYADDPDGLACPLGAHIRRAHPRDALKPYPAPQSLSMTAAHRLLRRGRVYGPPLFDSSVLQRLSSAEAHDTLLGLKDDRRTRGIHFLCVNASLKSQFEFVQQTWCSNPHFGGLNDNPDPLLGDRRQAHERPGRMTIPRDGGSLRTRPLPRFVTVRAGVYLFMPSLTALRFLGSVPDRATAWTKPAARDPIV